MRNRLLRCLAGVCITALSVIGPVQANYSTITDLGTLGAPNNCLPTAINDSTQIVGYGTTGIYNPHAWLWSSGTMTDLGTLSGGTLSAALAINNSGTIVGWSYDSASVQHPFVYTSSGGMVDLFPSNWGSRWGVAYGINDSGTIIAKGDLTNSAPYHPFTYLNGTTTDLSSHGMYVSSWPTGINSTGQIAGYGLSIGTIGFTYASGTQTALPLLGGSQVFVNAINQLGQIVGYGQLTGNLASHAFCWTPNSPNGISGTITDLGVLSGGTNSYAFGLNAWGTVVGKSETTTGPHAFIWTTCGGMVDLNTLLPSGSGWTLTIATGINSLGQIVGQGTNSSGGGRGFLLSP